MISAILLAAGSSRRFGRDKLTAIYKGRPLYMHALDMLMATPAVAETVVVVNPAFKAPDGLKKCRFIVNPEHEEGMGSSLRAGVRAASDAADAYVIALADMPDIDSRLVAAMIEFHNNAGAMITVPVYKGWKGHPVVMSGRLRDELLTASGDIGARVIIERHADSVAEFKTPSAEVVRDVDTEDGMNEKILIKGAGEMASAVAHRLFRCGFRVAMTEIAKPSAVRRRVSFCSAVYDGGIEIEGVKGVLCRASAGEIERASGGAIAVVVDPQCGILKEWRPDILVDGRILKHNPDTRICDAGVVIALGPGFSAGRDAHFVIETNRGHDLGRIITSGSASDDTGEPGDVGGCTHERVLRAPAAGVFTGAVEIGSTVEKGDVTGVVAGREVRAQIAGVLRGIVHSGIEVECGQKLGDVDPRCVRSHCFTLSDKSRTISGSVLEIAVSHVRKKGSSPK